MAGLASRGSGLCLLLALAQTGCGKSGGAAPPAAPKAGGGEQALSAEAVARQARGPVNCPAKLATPPRAGAAPVDDVLGVRPGMSFEEAHNVVLCSHELLVATPPFNRGFDLKSAEARHIRQGFSAAFAQAHQPKTSRQIMQDLQIDALARGGNAAREDLLPGQARWFVGTMGLPGQERVLSVAREERFTAENSPTIDAVLAALTKKYGAASRLQRGSAGQLPLVRWAYDSGGRLVDASSPALNRCTGSSDPHGGVHLAPDCGLVVQAMLVPQRSNPELVDRLQVGVVDQAGGFRSVSATEQALAQQDQLRRAQEVQRAGSNAKAPSL